MSYCVEMWMSNRRWMRWLAMHGRWSADGPLVDIPREKAIKLAAQLPRHGGKFTYRVRRYR